MVTSPLPTPNRRAKATAAPECCALSRPAAKERARMPVDITPRVGGCRRLPKAISQIRAVVWPMPRSVAIQTATAGDRPSPARIPIMCADRPELRKATIVTISA